MRRTFCYRRNGQYFTKVVIIEENDGTEVYISNSIGFLEPKKYILENEDDTKNIKESIKDFINEIETEARKKDELKEEILKFLEENNFEIQEEEEE